MSSPSQRRKKLRSLYQTQKRKCFYCRKRCVLFADDSSTPTAATIEHLYPVGDIRRLIAPNTVVMACRKCNQEQNNAFIAKLHAPQKGLPRINLIKLLSELPISLTSKTVKTMEINLTVTHTFSPEAFALLGQLLDRGTETATAGTKPKAKTAKAKDEAPAQAEAVAEVKTETAPAASIFSDLAAQKADVVTETTPAAPVTSIFGDPVPATAPAPAAKPATLEEIRVYFMANIAGNSSKEAKIAPKMEELGVPFNEALNSRPISALKSEQYTEFLAFLKSL